MFDTKQKHNVVYNGSIPGSPADKAGMVIGDTILSVNGHAIYDYVDYIAAIANRNGKQVMDILRSGRLIEVTLELPATPIENPNYNDIVAKLQATSCLPKSESGE